jgi:sugar diacid utilization regulator
MQLSDSFWEMADHFVSYIHGETGFSTIVCDDRGIITKAYVRQRIGQPHAGAQKILSNAIREIAISEDEARRNPLVKEGVSRAIVIDGEKVGTFGITGKLELVTPVARLAAMVMAGWLKQLRQQELLHATADKVSGDIRLLTDKIETTIGSFENVGNALAMAANEAAASVATTDMILKSVQEIALQTYMLSINASIEAGRLGSLGQAFSVVADEMGRLSKVSKESVQSVENTMDNIRTAISHVQATSQQSSALLVENVGTMRAIAPMVQTLMASIKALENSFKENLN